MPYYILSYDAGTSLYPAIRAQLIELLFDNEVVDYDMELYVASTIFFKSLKNYQDWEKIMADWIEDRQFNSLHFVLCQIAEKESVALRFAHKNPTLYKGFEEDMSTARKWRIAKRKSNF